MPMCIVRYIYIFICHPISHWKHKLIVFLVKIAFLTLNKIIHKELIYTELQKVVIYVIYFLRDIIILPLNCL